MFYEDNNGDPALVLSKIWPDGNRYRRRQPNMTVAKIRRARIEESIAMGTWQKVRKELNNEGLNLGNVSCDLTVAELAPIYFSEYCKIHNTRSLGFKQTHLKDITEIVGHIKLTAFTMDDAEFFKRMRLADFDVHGNPQAVGNDMVMKGMAVMNNMFNFAVDPKQYLIVNPMARYKRLKITEGRSPLRKRQELPAEHAKRIIDAAFGIDPFKATFIALCSEWALRPWAEGVNLKRRLCDMRPRRRPEDERWLTIEPSKHSSEGRRIPLTDYAIELARSLPVIVGTEYLFFDPETGGPLTRERVERVMLEAERIAGITWPRMYDLTRHFRATMWCSTGVPLVNVQKWLDHKRIQTTMKYAKPVDDQRHLREAHEKEKEMEREREMERLDDQKEGENPATA